MRGASFPVVIALLTAASSSAPTPSTQTASTPTSSSVTSATPQPGSMAGPSALKQIDRAALKVLNQRHLRRLMKKYVRYYHEDRTHLGLGKDTPGGRAVAVASPSGREIVSLPRLGGLHHRYTLAA